jgi:hypothetical protein
MTATWAPTLAEVGGCIPTRTVNVNLPGNLDYLNTFTTDTRPTATQAQAVIDHAVNDVLEAVSAVPTALEEAAANAAMWRAAADIELAYPERNADADYYAKLNDRAKYAWDLLLKAAEADGTSNAATLPVWYAGTAPWWADRTDL